MFYSFLLAFALLAGCKGDTEDDTSATDGGATDGGTTDGGGDGGLSGTVQVDLGTDPETGETMPDWTVLSDQLRSVGILFDALPDTVDPVVAWWGGDEASLFFSPDIYGVTAVFSFVEPGSHIDIGVTGFSLVPWFNPGESAELVGLDASGAEVVVDGVTPEDIGSEAQGIEMEISGSFHTVEWRTHGDPGISAGELTFTW